jgi:hypothetical protein
VGGLLHLALAAVAVPRRPQETCGILTATTLNVKILLEAAWRSTLGRGLPAYTSIQGTRDDPAEPTAYPEVMLMERTGRVHTAPWPSPLCTSRVPHFPADEQRGHPLWGCTRRHLGSDVTQHSETPAPCVGHVGRIHGNCCPSSQALPRSASDATPRLQRWAQTRWSCVDQQAPHAKQKALL